MQLLSGVLCDLIFNNNNVLYVSKVKVQQTLVIYDYDSPSLS